MSKCILNACGLSWLILLSPGSGQVRVIERGSEIVLENARLVLVISTKSERSVLSLTDRRTGMEFVEQSAASPLVQLRWSKSGETPARKRWLDSQHATAMESRIEKTAGAARVFLTFKQLNGTQISVRCSATVSDQNDFVLWGIRVTGPPGVVLEQIIFPTILLRLPLGRKGAEDAVVAGLAKGGVFHNPYGWKQGQGISANQPGSLCAQFACAYTPQGGFYTSTQDPRGFPKRLEIRKTRNGLRNAWIQFCFHNLNKPFELGYPVAWTTFQGAREENSTGWRDAADIYKRWALAQPWCARTLAERADLPDWLKSGPAMVRFSRNWLARPERIESWLRDYWKAQFPKAPLIVAFWGWEHVDPWISPRYFPPFPSENGFARCIQAVRRANGHPFLWPSGYHWAVTYSEKPDGTFLWDNRVEFEKTGRAHAALKPGGKPFLRKCRWLFGGENALLCRGDSWTRQWFNHIAEEIVKRGADMVQVDQVVGAASPGRCFSRNHGHPPGPGLWETQAFSEQLESLAATTKKIDPNTIIGFEEPQELFLQQVGIQDYRDIQKQRWPDLPGLVPASIFGYLYHEFIPEFQSNPRAGDRLGLAYCLANGQVPHWSPHWPLIPSPLLRNGDFETWVDDVPDGWARVKKYKKQVFHGRSYRDDKIKHQGASSLRLECKADDDMVQVSQNVAIGEGGLAAGRTYRLSLWFMAEKLALANNVLFGAFDPQVRALKVWRVPLRQVAEWTRGQADFTIPAGATFLRVMLHVSGRAKVWLDDVAIEEVTGSGEVHMALSRGKPAEHEFVQQWVELFHGKGRPFLLLGRMVHPPRLIEPRGGPMPGSTLPPVLLNAYRSPDGKEAIIAVNATGQAQKAVFEKDGRAWKVELQPWQAELVTKD